MNKTDRPEHDYYATPAIAIDKLLQHIKLYHTVWECTAGGGHMSNKLRDMGYNVKATELYEPDLVIDNNIQFGVDFFKFNSQDGRYKLDIVTNPPYKTGLKFVIQALDLVAHNQRVCMFLPLFFLETKPRYKLFKQHPPQMIIVMVDRINCAKNGNFEAKQSGLQRYAWFVWQKGYNGETIVRWA